jgi:hypothetical protein
LGKFTATYAKLFKTLVFAATRPKQRAIPVQTGVVPVFPSSAHSEPKMSNAAQRFDACKALFPAIGLATINTLILNDLNSSPGASVTRIIFVDNT